MGANRESGKEASFEEHLAALERVVADLEGDALTLEQSIERYKKGVAHLATCRRILDAAEQRLAELAQAPDGTIEERPLRVGAEGLEDAGAPPPPARRPEGARRPEAPRAPERPPRAAAKEGPPAAVPADDELPF
jgi:exodeoxyribonuclease VII small subunit